MTPAQETEVLEKLRMIDRRTADTTILVHKLAHMMTTYHEGRRRDRALLDRVIEWVNVFRRDRQKDPTLPPPRETMPSLSADDSGSIDLELSLHGARGKFTGPGPLRVAGALLLVAAIIAGAVVTMAAESSAHTHQGAP